MKHTTVLCALSAMTLGISCTKEALVPEPESRQIQPMTGERFDPVTDQVMPLILGFKAKKEAYAFGAKSDLGEKGLQEAVWLAEALMNYEKGDAGRYGDEWITGTLEYSFPVHLKDDGSVWLYESDFYSAYDAAMVRVNASVGSGKIYTIDHEVLSVENGIAAIQIEWSDKDPTSSIPVGWGPEGSGCHDVDDACVLLTGLLHHNFHQIAPLAPSFYVTLWPPNTNYWGVVTDNESVVPNSFGYQGYFGTTVGQGGGGLWFNGNNFTNAVCFPAQWHKFVESREIIMEHVFLAPPYEFVREKVSWLGYNVGQIGIPLYPQGFYHLEYYYKVGRLVTPLTGG
ncbi:MAG: hypothetical protein IPP83_19980 [Flavobacteriales bacterium]|nr:hypothetical protein [Flavobacteriales bacterium]